MINKHKKLHVYASLLTGTIYGGHILKGKKGTPNKWAVGKQDVTDDAISAVINHFLITGRLPINVTIEDEMQEYILMITGTGKDRKPELIRVKNGT